MAKVPSLNGDKHVKTTGSQAVAHKVIIVQGIIRGGSQADAQYVVLLSIPLFSVLVLSSPKSRVPSGKRLLGPMKMTNGMTSNGSLKSMRRPRARKVKGRIQAKREV